MNLYISKIDYENCSLDELEAEIKRLGEIRDEYYNKEQSIKIFINSCYGACASPFYECYNIFVAEATTLQGQNMIKFTNTVIDEYFINHWHLDKEVHDKLGLTHVNKITVPTTVVYNDTDSTYISFQHALESCDYKGTDVEFILDLNRIRLQQYLDDCFVEYAKSYNTSNVQKLELEKISHSVLMVAKKKYILELAWKEPGVFYKPLEKIKPTGIEIIQGSTPKFARKVLNEIINMIFEKNTNLTYFEVVKVLKKYKEQFKLQHPDDISKTVNVGGYEKFIIEDKDSVLYAQHCPVHIKASGIYNHELMKSNYMSKYELIKTGDKCKYYYTSENCNVFAFLPKNYPVEFAYPIDYDKQFDKLIISPVNRYISALGMMSIPASLTVSRAAF
ncbi:MAG: DNA polymerase domain-containing protein [Bacteroidales bacterium]